MKILKETDVHKSNKLKKIIYCFHVYSTFKCLIPPSLWWENHFFSLQKFVSLVAKELITFGRSLEITFWEEPLLLFWSWSNSVRWKHYFYFYLDAMLWNGGGIALGSISRKQHCEMEVLLLYIPVQSQCFVQYVQILVENGCHSCSMDLNFIVPKIHANMDFLW
jgi:hypothetical protein